MASDVPPNDATATTAGTVLWNRSHATPRGDLVMTLDARTPDGAAPPGDALRKAADTLLARLSGAGYEHPTVNVMGDRTVSVRVGADGSTDGLKALAQPGRLSFRAVVSGPSGITPAAAGPTATGPTATGPTVAGPTVAGPTATGPTATGPTSAASGLAAVVTKLGPAYQAAQAITDPNHVDQATLDALAPFGVLTPDEVAVLPSAMQFAVPTITCAQLNGRALGAIDDPGVPVAACERTGTQAKYLLDVARVTATDVAGADVRLEATSGWTVTIRFTPAGQGRWTALTRAAMRDDPSNQVAIVVDNQVISAPTIQAVIVGDATIAGAEIDRDAARRLGALLRSGPLPVTFAVSSVVGVK
ncbi:MAG: hypothetical protein AUI14_04690 [Actinobacteria bacterium 13_2_20CM_2_71_6]|nr:MAG: hypothetical protein AUI14_04690 [Actinobacteria bacterium 13_2_20CM_2_71_6]